MATARPKESSAPGKEKVTSSALNSQSTSTKKNTKPCTTSDKPTSSEKHIPNYLKPTISSRLESHSSSKNTKIDSLQRPVINRRRSLDKPPSPSQLSKHNQSSSRLHKALVSPGPRERSGSQLRSLSFSPRSTVPSKPSSEKISRTLKDGKLSTKTVNKSRKSPSPTPKKVARDGSATSSSAKAPKSNAETTEALKNVETLVDAENENKHKEEHEQDQVVDESKHDEPPIEVDSNDNLMPTASEEEEEEAKADSVAEDIKLVVEEKEAEEEHPPKVKAEDLHQEDENKSPDESMDHLEPEDQKVEVEEEEEEEDNEVSEEQERENENNEEERANEDKEGVEGETDEGDKLKERKEEEEDDNVENTEVKEEKTELTAPKQQGGEGGQGTKESPQVSNDVIEETASKLLEKRANKVLALAGAFQTVIDHQSK